MAEQQSRMLIESTLAAVVGADEQGRILADGVRLVLRGDTWIDPAPRAPWARSAESSMRNLTQRERQVLMGVFEGLSNKEVAARLRLSEESVKSFSSYSRSGACACGCNWRAR